MKKIINYLLLIPTVIFTLLLLPSLIFTGLLLVLNWLNEKLVDLLKYPVIFMEWLFMKLNG